MREYVVTLKKNEDLNDFYEDMESVCDHTHNHIPSRDVECCKRRPTSRNTNYFLTDEEAELLRTDNRVLAVELTHKEMGIKVTPCFTQTSTSWDKSWTKDVTDVNWGLLRCFQGSHIIGWGSDNTSSQTGTVKLTSTGKHVDVIIVDGHLDPTHPEMAVNNDGTGGTRVNRINWYDFSTPSATLGIQGDQGKTYDYEPANTYGEDHGMHVAGTVAGNTQGWARDANIYNLSPYGNDLNMDDAEIFEYIRAFHNNKSINSETGRRNPTIINNSWSYSYSFSINSVTSVTFRGVEISGPFTAGQLNSYGIDTDGANFISPTYSSAVDADIEDAIDDGVIVVCAASNDNMKISTIGDQDYDNFLLFDELGPIYAIYYNRPFTPSGTANVICVGAVSNTSDESKAYYSNCGPRVDIFAPGTAIQSSLIGDATYGSADPRGNGLIGKYQGTSMASPQVCGVLACLLEQMPNLTHQEARDIIIQHSGKDEMFDSNTNNNDQQDDCLQGAPNRYLKYITLRPLSGSMFPKEIVKSRPNSGAMYPRRNIRYK